LERFFISTPVVLIIFNRPEKTKRLLSVIRQAAPSQLFVIADGPRPDSPRDADLCRDARAIIDGVDWECQVSRDFADHNLGCGERIARGLDWVFSSAEEAIILEDDCIPDPTFFRFCHELLARYREDQRVMAISGHNFQFGRRRTDYSYYFSRYCHGGGWACWRRSWRLYDGKLSRWPEIRAAGTLHDIFEDAESANYWLKIFDAVHGGARDIWDYQWNLVCWLQNGLTILPEENLVTNAGFDEQATHSKVPTPAGDIPAQAVAFPLRHPPFVVRHARADVFTQRTLFRPHGFWRRLVGRAQRLF
jgi:hypothetical protein